jgi:regulation of enolase protein 1 (concanavalin A-like superfamily)
MRNYAGRATRQRWCVATRLFTIRLALIVAPVLIAQNAAAQSLPAGWTLSDVASPRTAGRASFSGSTFTVEGAGARIGLDSDQFSFLQQRITGDVTIVARVTSFENTSSSAKAGVMIREALTTGSKHAFALVTPGSSVGFHRRTAINGGTAGTNGSGSAPLWVRLVRSGSTITASRSTNGTSWTTIGSSSISMSSAVYVGLAVSSYDTSNAATATFTNVSVSAASSGGSGGSNTWPAGWSGTDVANPVVNGNASYSNSTFHLTAGGTDIGGTSDQFGLIYRQVSGDVDVVARIASLTGPDAASKAGVMVRTSLAANAAHASMLLTRSNGLAFIRRPGAGLASLTTSGGSATAPVWVKLERRGSAVTAFRSADGNSWTMVGSETLTIPSTFYVGLAGASRSTSSAVNASFANVSVGPGSSNPLTPPTVSLSSPAANATFTAPATVSIGANASDPDDGVALVEFYANGNLLGTDATSPYSYSWTNVASGTYSLTAVARDNRGAIATSSARSITVNGGGSTNTPPTVSLTAPAAGSTFTAPATITVSATAADSNGTVARVDFYSGSTLIGTDTTSPYSISWTNVSAGTFSLTAVARDNAGATTTSAARSITVNGATSIATRAVFSPSPDHSTVTRYVLEVFTAGANPNTATPIATRDLGRPSVVSGVIDVDIASLVSGLPGGNYFATVYAMGAGGNSARAVSASFSR